MDVRAIPSERQSEEELYLEPLVINHFAGVECAHSVNLHNCLEGIEGKCASRAEEVSSSIYQTQHSESSETHTPEQKGKSVEY